MNGLQVLREEDPGRAQGRRRAGCSASIFICVGCRSSIWPGGRRGLPSHVCLRRMDGLQVLREEGQERAEVRRRVGCSARIKKLQRHDNGPWPATLTVIAEGAHVCLATAVLCPCPSALCVPSFDAFPAYPCHTASSCASGSPRLHMLNREDVQGSKLRVLCLFLNVYRNWHDWCSIYARFASIACDRAVLNTGCQRLEVLQHTSHLSWQVRICADPPTPRLPREALEGRAHWARWVWRLSDPWELAARATGMFSDVFPDVRLLQKLLAGCLFTAPHISTESVAAFKACTCIHGQA